MLKQLFHDFYMTMDSEYQPTTFKPYLSMILSIVFITVIGFSIQTITTTLHTYAADPTAINTDIQQKTKTCSDFEGKFYFYLCQGIKPGDATLLPTTPNYFGEQDLHKLTN